MKIIIDPITEYARQNDEIQKNEKAKNEKYKKVKNFSDDALDGYPSIQSWEDAHGRGFWGNSTTGYIYDKDNK